MTVETASNRFLVPENIALNPGDAFFELSQAFRDLVSRRAYELFELRGSVHGYDREDWLQAESEILLNAPVDITETESGLTIHAAVPGFTESELEVRVAPHSLCITGRRQETSERTDEKVVIAERNSRQIFRAFELPAEVDPDTVNAIVNNGVLEIELLKVAPGKKVPVLSKAALA